MTELVGTTQTLLSGMVSESNHGSLAAIMNTLEVYLSRKGRKDNEITEGWRASQRLHKAVAESTSATVHDDVLRWFFDTANVSPLVYGKEGGPLVEAKKAYLALRERELEIERESVRDKEGTSSK